VRAVHALVALLRLLGSWWGLVLKPVRKRNPPLALPSISCPRLFPRRSNTQSHTSTARRHRADEMFDMPPDMDLFGAEFQELLAPQHDDGGALGEAARGLVGLGEWKKGSRGGSDRQPATWPQPAHTAPLRRRAHPSTPGDPMQVDAPAGGDAPPQQGPDNAGAAAARVPAAAGAKKRGTKRRANTLVVDPAGDLQIRRVRAGGCELRAAALHRRPRPCSKAALLQLPAVHTSGMKRPHALHHLIHILATRTSSPPTATQPTASGSRTRPTSPAGACAAAATLPSRRTPAPRAAAPAPRTTPPPLAAASGCCRGRGWLGKA
jgi:hypothetical protein